MSKDHKYVSSRENPGKVVEALSSITSRYWTTSLDESSHDKLKVFARGEKQVSALVSDWRSKKAIFDAIAEAGFLTSNLMDDRMVKPFQSSPARQPTVATQLHADVKPVAEAPKPSAFDGLAEVLERASFLQNETPLASKVSSGSEPIAAATVLPPKPAGKSVKKPKRKNGASGSHAAMVAQLNGRAEAVPDVSLESFKLPKTRAEFEAADKALLQRVVEYHGLELSKKADSSRRGSYWNLLMISKKIPPEPSSKDNPSVSSEQPTASVASIRMAVSLLEKEHKESFYAPQFGLRHARFC